MSPKGDPSLLSDEERERLARATAEIAKRGVPANTRRVYERAWNDFAEYCRHHGLRALPATAKTIAEYLVFQAANNRPYDTLRVIKAAIARKHIDEHYGNPTSDEYVKRTWLGLLTDMRETDYERGATMPETIYAMVDTIDAALTAAGPLAPQELRLPAARDRALILTLYEGALTLQELSSLRVGKIDPAPSGIRVTVWRSPDQRELKRKVTIGFGTGTHCAVAALEAWKKLGAIKSGPYFREIDRHGHVLDDPLTPRGIAFILNARGKDAGVDVHETGILGSRKLRIGRLVQAKLDGETDEQILERSGLHSMSKPRLLQTIHLLATGGEPRKRGRATVRPKNESS